METSTTKEQYLGLKVMRLLKPSLFSSIPFYKNNESKSDIFENVLLEKAFNSRDCADLNILTSFSLTDFLILPQSFGNIFIGEVFSSYICIHNHTVFDVRQLSVKVELQTKSQKIPIPLISAHGDYIEEFGGDQTFDGLIQHAVKELGVHVLICTVNYTTEKDEKMNFKKFFKFLVSKPFEIQPKFPYSEDENSVLFETQIQNVTSNILYMEKVTVEPMDGLIIEDLNSNKMPFTKSIRENDTSNNLVINQPISLFNCIKPTEIKQYLFRVRSADSQPLVKPLTIGKLDIIWRNPFSDIGRLQTNPLSQSPDNRPQIKRVLDIKMYKKVDLLSVGDSTEIDLEIKNVSEGTLDLEIKLQNSDDLGFLWDCDLNYKLGKLSSNDSYTLNLRIVPVQTGYLVRASASDLTPNKACLTYSRTSFKVLNGITITELLIKRVYDSLNFPTFVVV